MMHATNMNSVADPFCACHRWKEEGKKNTLHDDNIPSPIRSHEKEATGKAKDKG